MADTSFANEILQLSISCVKETFDHSLIKQGMRAQHDVYYGDYGWDDKTGQPLDVIPDVESPSAMNEGSKAMNDPVVVGGNIKPLIEEILVTPKHGTRLITNDHCIIFVQLPDIQSIDEIQFGLEESLLVVSVAGKYHLGVALPISHERASIQSATFIRQKETLKLEVTHQRTTH